MVTYGTPYSLAQTAVIDVGAAAGPGRRCRVHRRAVRPVRAASRVVVILLGQEEARMTIFRFALKRSFRNPFNILLLCVLPVGVVFLPVVPGSTLPLGFHLYGQVIMFAAFLMVRSTVEDRLSGVLTRIAVAPVSYFRYLWETLLAYGLLLVAQNAVVVGLGVVLYGESLGLAAPAVRRVRLLLPHVDRVLPRGLLPVRAPGDRPTLPLDRHHPALAARGILLRPSR